MLVFHDNMEKIKENQKAFHLCIVVLFIHVIAQEDEDLSSSSLALPQSVCETDKKKNKTHYEAFSQALLLIYHTARIMLKNKWLLKKIINLKIDTN